MGAPMGASDPDPYGALLEAPARFDASTDLTLAIEEEFQILDAETLSLRAGFKELRELAEGTPLAEHLAGELIECEVEVKTGRCESFAEAARLAVERRRQLLRARRPARRRALLDRHASVVAVAGAVDHRHAALPARRGVAALRRLAQQHVRHPRARRRPGRATVRSTPPTGCARSCPTCSRSARARRGRTAA